MFDPVRAVKVLRDHDVRFVLIGGLAAVARGSPVVTNDIDICYERTPQNIERMVAALTSVDARFRGAPPDAPFILDAKTIQMGDHFTFMTSVGPLDCLGTPAGTEGYGPLAANADEIDFDGLTVLVASIQDLIEMKRAAGRPKDLIMLEYLGALRDELGE